jgi:hypothetical protein
VHDLDQALAAAAAAAEAGRPVRLLTPRHGLFAQGPGYWAAVARRLAAGAERARAELWVDADDAPGLAMAALRSGLDRLVFTGPAELAEKLAAIAAQAGGRLARTRPTALDLADAADPRAAVGAALGRDTSADPAAPAPR